MLSHEPTAGVVSGDAAEWCQDDLKGLNGCLAVFSSTHIVNLCHSTSSVKGQSASSVRPQHLRYMESVSQPETRSVVMASFDTQLC